MSDKTTPLGPGIGPAKSIISEVIALPAAAHCENVCYEYRVKWRSGTGIEGCGQWMQDEQLVRMGNDKHPASFHWVEGRRVVKPRSSNSKKPKKSSTYKGVIEFSQCIRPAVWCPGYPYWLRGRRAKRSQTLIVFQIHQQ